ncbi:MAG: peptide/nickel transport system substrate-binding protein [Thermomicrobiales bacterium]|nr:peptide/nickel transport system substrate-binding protein [Thermomicrobiales bacterium]
METSSNRTSAKRDERASLVRQVWEGQIDRRDFLRRAVALGIAPAVAATVFTTYRARPAAASPTGRGSIRADRRQDSSPTPTTGGTFRFGRGEDSVTFDPVATFYNADIWLLQNVYEQLLRVAPNGTELEPSLATSWDISTDGLTYTFHLRPGVTFHDGSALKASDVKFSMERAKNDPNNIWTFTMVALEEVTTPDDATVVAKLNQPWAPFLADIAMFNCAVMPEAWAKGNEQRLPTEMNGTGPFAFAEFVKGEHVLLKKNSNYWDEGLPYLDEVNVIYVPDDNARILQLQGGELDGMHNVPTSRVEELGGDENLQVLQFPSSYSQYMVFNHKADPLDDVNVRLALNYATDKQSLIQIVLFGNGVEATSFMPKGALYWNDELPGFPYNLDTAKEYLAKSKVPNGFTIEFQYQAGNAEIEQLAAAVKDMWAQINVEVAIAPTELSVFNDNFSNESFQIMCTYWTNDIIDPDELVAFAIEPKTANAFHTSWTNAEAVDLAAKGRAEQDAEKRKQMYFRIQELFNQDAAMGLLYHKPFINVLSKNVHGFDQPPTGQWIWKETWIEQ